MKNALTIATVALAVSLTATQYRTMRAAELSADSAVRVELRDVQADIRHAQRAWCAQVERAVIPALRAGVTNYMADCRS